MDNNPKKRKREYPRWVRILLQCSVDLSDDHVSAYAAMAAFFFIISMIPIMLIILTLIQYTPATEADFMEILVQIFPETVLPTIESVIDEVYRYSAGMIPLNFIVAMWSAGKAVLSISKGLNCVHDMIETRGYVEVRLRGSFYTVLMILAIIFMLVLQVFGLQLAAFLENYIPIIHSIVEYFVSIRTWITIIFVGLVAWALYITMPNKKIRPGKELPGAIFVTIGWNLCSWLFSMYLKIFKGFQNMYGSLTTIILIMLWLYFCMYILLLGAEVNLWLGEFNVIERIPVIGEIYARREAAYIERVRQHNMELVRKQSHYQRRIEPGYKNREQMQKRK